MKQIALMVLVNLTWAVLGKSMGAPTWAAFMFGTVCMFIYFPPPKLTTHPTQEADK